MDKPTDAKIDPQDGNAEVKSVWKDAVKTDAKHQAKARGKLAKRIKDLSPQQRDLLLRQLAGAGRLHT